MSVVINLECGGCDAKAERVGTIRMEFVSFSGRGHGFGRTHQRIEINEPEGWMVWDPVTFCTYCPDCWASIVETVAVNDKERNR